MRAAEDQRIDFRKLPDVTGHGQARDLRLLPRLLDERRKERRGDLADLHGGAEFPHFGAKGVRRHGAGGAEKSDVPAGHRHGSLRRRDRDAQNPTFGRAVAMLKMPQRHARNRVTRHHDHAAAFAEKALDALLGKIEHGVRVAPAIRRAAAVAEIDIVELREFATELPEHGQAAEAAVINADGGRGDGGKGHG